MVYRCLFKICSVPETATPLRCGTALPAKCFSVLHSCESRHCGLHKVCVMRVGLRTAAGLLLLLHCTQALDDTDTLLRANKSNPTAWNSFLDQIPVPRIPHLQVDDAYGRRPQHSTLTLYLELCTGADRNNSQGAAAGTGSFTTAWYGPPAMTIHHPNLATLCGCVAY